MTDISAIFQYKTPDIQRLLSDGFRETPSGFEKAFPIIKKQFTMNVSVSRTGEVTFKVTETETGEEYALVHVPNASGEFVGEVRSACEKVLCGISEKCFVTDRLKAEQTRAVTEFIGEQFGVSPDFPWENYPDYAAFRVSENGKWFALIMTVDRSRIGLSGSGNIEIMNLKDTPENVEKRIDGKNIFPAYHMNKKHWYTVWLNGGLPFSEVAEMVKISYKSASGKK